MAQLARVKAAGRRVGGLNYDLEGDEPEAESRPSSLAVVGATACCGGTSCA
jgi:hypothetical protein